MNKVHPEVAKNIGLVIKYNRQKKGISQEKLAKRVGIARAYLSRIETQDRTPSFLMFKEIARKLGKTTTEMGIEALSENCDGELLALKAMSAVKKVLQGGDRAKQQKLLKFLESLVDS